jgi:hypothetical protein
MKTQAHNNNNNNNNNNTEEEFETIHISMKLVLSLLLVLLIIIMALTGAHNKELVEYPTILTVLGLLGSCLWYIYMFPNYTADDLCNLAFHLQFVGVPLAVLAMATAGVRLWTDVLGHLMLLSAAVHNFWLQRVLKHAWGVLTAKVLTVILPLISLVLAYMQYADDWKYTIALMGCAGLLPLFLFTVIVPSEDPKRFTKIQMRITHLCACGALLSLVVNLALFYEE